MKYTGKMTHFFHCCTLPASRVRFGKLFCFVSFCLYLQWFVLLACLKKGRFVLKRGRKVRGCLCWTSLLYAFFGCLLKAFSGSVFRVEFLSVFFFLFFFFLQIMLYWLNYIWCCFLIRVDEKVRWPHYVPFVCSAFVMDVD